MALEGVQIRSMRGQTVVELKTGGRWVEVLRHEGALPNLLRADALMVCTAAERAGLPVSERKR